MGGLTADPEVIDLSALDADWEIPCDFGQFARGDWADIEHGPARWILRRVRCVCGFVATRLVCDNCKEACMTTEAGCICRVCDDFTAPFRRTIASIEPLEKSA